MAPKWEPMLRQRDVIGEWEPFDPAEGQISAHLINGHQWANGVTCEDVSSKWILAKVTTKTGAERFDLISAHYERRSMLITANQLFGE